MTYKHTAKHSFDHPLPVDARYNMMALIRVLRMIKQRRDMLESARVWLDELYPDGRHDVASGQDDGTVTSIRTRVLQRMAEVRNAVADSARREAKQSRSIALAGRGTLPVASVGTRIVRADPPLTGPWPAWCYE
jgi:hypothetical protein